MTRPVDILLHHLRGVASSHVECEASLARSVLKQLKRRNWKPSPKQLSVMKRMVGDLFSENGFVVIED